jgi:SAM-dependent methyltransferase
MNNFNQDHKTVESFGKEWTRFDQSGMTGNEQKKIFDEYFSIFPWQELPPLAVGLDIGCGSGRWAALVAPKIGHLHCLDASAEALAIAHRKLADRDNVSFYCESVGSMPFEESSLDFCYSLGVLHHVPDTADAIRMCAKVLKPGAPMLLYLYYALDNRPIWFRALWRASNAGRVFINKLPDRLKDLFSDVIAFSVYWPLARFAWAIERLGGNVHGLPLAYYRNHSLYTMRTDSRDRFGTPLEQRFSLEEIRKMLADAGLERIVHSSKPPYWCVVGHRKK